MTTAWICECREIPHEAYMRDGPVVCFRCGSYAAKRGPIERELRQVNARNVVTLLVSLEARKLWWACAMRLGWPPWEDVASDAIEAAAELRL